MTSVAQFIRHAVPSDAETIRAIEEEADTVLVDSLGAREWPPAGDAIDRIDEPGFVLVIEDAEIRTPLGFVHVMDADGHAHLDQLSVLPAAGRQGFGRRLIHAAIDEARDRGYSRMTLRTYAEIAWNAPFYASCGFLESLPESPFQRALVEAESEMGLDNYGRRIQMTIEL